MNVLSVVSNTPEWMAIRAMHDTASEAPAAFGQSKYTSRTDLMKQKATGLIPEVGAAKQTIFNRGHAAEASARSLAEGIIESELYPATANLSIDGLALLASLDGATMDEEIIWEHKLYSESLATDVRAGTLDPHYTLQLDQQLLVSGAKKCLFMTSDGTADKMAWCWYESSPEKFAALVAGWKQFRADLAAYVPPEVIVPAVAAPQMGLPAVSITVNGSIALVDNLDKFGAALTAYVERINKKPETDQDFADLEATVKTLKTAEEALDAAEANALAQTDSIDAMRRTVALYRETARTNRLLVTNLVKAEKENRRLAIVSDAAAELVTHTKKLNERLGKPYMPNMTADFQGVIKGLKSLDSMKDKVSTELARCKIAANEAADRIQANLETLRDLAREHVFLFADTAQLVGKANDDLIALVKSRIADHKATETAKEEATRERIRKEEQEKAERKALEAKEAEDALVLSFERNARRIEFDSVPYIEKASRTYESTAKDWEHDPRPRVAAAYAAGRAYLKERLEAAQQRTAEAATTTVQATQPSPAAAAITHADVVNVMMPPAVRQAMAPAATKPTTPPDLKLGQINERLAPIQLTAEGLRTLGFEPAGRDRAAVLYHASDFDNICAALVKHINSVCEPQEA